MRARQAAPIYFISTLIKRKLIATSLIMLQAAFDDANGKKHKNTMRRLRGSVSSTWTFTRQRAALMMKINRRSPQSRREKLSDVRILLQEALESGHCEAWVFCLSICRLNGTFSSIIVFFYVLALRQLLGLWNRKTNPMSCACYRKVPPCKQSQTKHLNPISVPNAPAAPPLTKTPYVSVDQLQKFSVTMVYDYMRISLREGLQEE